MTRTLSLIAAASFVLAVACLSGAVALGWHGFAHHHWGPWGHGWHVHVKDDDGDVWVGDHNVVADGAQTTREIAWNGGDRLDLDLGADVTFNQAPGPAKLTISGPAEAVQNVELSGSHLQFANGNDYSGGPLKVTLTAPAVRHFAINGSGDLAINGYDQDQLDLDVSGSGNVTAHGKARALKLDISGSGDVDAGSLAAGSADADISGSGKASIAPTDTASLRISGDGEIDLMSHPAKVTSDVSGSGRIVEGGQAPAQLTAPAPPTRPS